nr:hypothetical protein [Tanacetum cinerariifolium]
VMDAPTFSVSAGSLEGNFGDTIDIREAIRGIYEHLLGVSIQEELSGLRFMVDIIEAENASLRGTIRTIEAIEMVTRKHKRLARIDMERQLISV